MESTGTGSRYPVVDMNMNGKSVRVQVPQFLVVLLYYCCSGRCIYVVPVLEFRRYNTVDRCRKGDFFYL
jgi:hypothetical protein